MKKLKTIILILSLILICLFIVSNINAINSSFDVDSTVNELIYDFNSTAIENLLSLDFNNIRGLVNGLNGFDPLNVDSVDNVTKVPFMFHHCGVSDPEKQCYVVVDVYSVSSGRGHEYKTPFTSVEGNTGFFDDQNNFEVIISLDGYNYYATFNDKSSHVQLVDSYYTGPNNEQLHLVLHDPDPSMAQVLTLHIYRSCDNQYVGDITLL